MTLTPQVHEAEAGLPEHDGLPFVSVLVPVRNEKDYIGPCLQALGQQDYPREMFEVLVLDGESDDGTAEEAAQAAETFGVPDVFITNKLRTTATGLNLGLTLARGEVIVRVDGHTLVDPKFISASVEALLESGADAVGGPIQTRGRGPTGQAIALAMSSRFGIGDSAFRYAKDRRWTDSVPFAAYRRHVFEQNGGFDVDILGGEDDEFNYRLREAGGSILLDPAISSIYYARSSYRGLARQYWQYGVAKAEVLGRHPGRLRPRHLALSTLVLSMAAGALLGSIDSRFSWLFRLAAGAYAVANLGASIWIGIRGRHWRSCLAFLLLSPSFTCAPARVLSPASCGGSRVTVADERQVEADRVRAAYARRAQKGLDSRYAYWEPANLYTYQTRERGLVQLLQSQGMLPLSSAAILDVGCGEGAVLADLVRLGADAGSLHGVDLLPARVAAAERRLPGADFRVGDAQDLPYADRSFDLVLAFTMLSSVAVSARRRVAAEVTRVLRPGGLVVVYDFWTNPFNRDARPVRRSELRDLFAGRDMDFRAATLAPPLVRALVPLPGGWFACSLMEVLPFLKTHYLAAIRI